MDADVLREKKGQDSLGGCAEEGESRLRGEPVGCAPGVRQLPRKRSRRRLLLSQSPPATTNQKAGEPLSDNARIAKAKEHYYLYHEKR